MKATTGVLNSEHETRIALEILTAKGFAPEQLRILAPEGAEAAGPAARAGGVPEEEMRVYLDALRKGRWVVIVAAEDERRAGEARRALRESGAESVDAAREEGTGPRGEYAAAPEKEWMGLRDLSRDHYDGDPQQ